MKSTAARIALYLGLLVGLALLAGCAGEQPVATATPTPRDDTEVRAALIEGVHGDTYDLGTGPNTYCAACKSPANYDPQSVIDAPPNCVSCKFESDTQMRVAVGNPVVAEHEWEGIRCHTCHPDAEDGSVSEEVAWWNAVDDTYEPQESSTALCEQCHRTTGNGVDRQREIADSLVHTDATCTTCHDPHSGAASCESCHNEADTDTAYVTDCLAVYVAEDATMPHPDVTCQSCHDNSGLAAEPVEDAADGEVGQWVTWRTSLIAGVIPSTGVWTSHNLGGDVDCTRCHYADNPWNLESEVEPQ